LRRREFDSGPGNDAAGGHAREGAPTRLYRRFMHAVLERPVRGWTFLGVITLLLLCSLALVPLGSVKVKMLPFDNKSEFQIVLNMPEGSALEETLKVAQEMAHRVAQEPEVTDYQVYAGAHESPVYAIMEMNKALHRLDMRSFGATDASIRIYNAKQPFLDFEPSIKWDGEWHITIEVFRDLGMAFAVVLVLIYVLMEGWFKSFLTPLIVMAAIPFSLVGILPAHGLMGAFFTATSMIGFMAGAGIVVRNSIILVDFIQLRLKQGMPPLEAVVDAGTVRFRPMALTAMAVVVGAAVILADPIFQGLAVSLMAGELASLFISRLAVPILFCLANAR
jgi:multidrug efflux pump subunit AcrB